MYNYNPLSQNKPTFYYCSKCGRRIVEFPHKFLDKPYTLCPHCYDEYRSNTMSLEDFVKEIDFKVGDQVITSDGRIGFIIYICTCDKCKERGFCEPVIQYNNSETDCITALDKNNGFKNFYKIGNQIFGNLDDRDVLYRMKTIKEEMRELESQLAVINQLKNN